ncbi:MAG: DUF4349 domain-containing protein [Anaerolineae bacterium]|nr:DUF4349 domain-containing protein [Anaerolineae bacterium]
MKQHTWIGLVLAAALLLTTGACATYMSAPAEPYYDEIGVEQEGGWVSDAPVSADSGEAPGYGRGEGVASDAISVERMVIRTGELDIIVPETVAAIDDIREIVEELDGYVVTLNTYQYDQGVRGSITIRVPAEDFDTAIEQISALASTVVRRSVSGQDVTSEYVDLESHLRHLRAVEEQLLEFLEDAEDTEATLSVYSQLSSVQSEIEQVRGQMQYLENQAALSTIVVSLTPDALAQPLEVSGWNLPGTFREAVQSLVDVLEFAIKALIYIVIVILPTLLLMALPIFGVAVLIRALVRRRKQRKASAE